MTQALCEPVPGVKGFQQIQILDYPAPRLNCRVVDEQQRIVFGGTFEECQNYLAAIGLRLMWDSQP